MGTEWPVISRVGEPELISRGDHGSVQEQNVYHVHTSQLPGGPDGYNWAMLFGSQFTGQRRISGHHDGISKAVIYCWPDDVPKLTETVDAAIEYANKGLG
jgi:hypothetical protein